MNGLVNAAADVNVLVDISNGNMPGPNAPASATLPVQTMNTLANALAYCTNSTGGTAGDGSRCGNLFSSATPPGNSAPTEMVTAALNIAKNPARNVGSVYSWAQNVNPAPPFTPYLSAAPNDYTLALSFTGNGLGSSSAVAIDAASNVWVTNTATNSLSEFSHTGSPTTSVTNGISFPSAVAIDQSGIVWVANKNTNSVSRVNASSGSLLTGSPITGGGLNAPNAVAIDSLGNAWITNGGGNSLTSVDSTGSTVRAYTPAGVASPTAIGANPH